MDPINMMMRTNDVHVLDLYLLEYHTGTVLSIVRAFRFWIPSSSQYN